MIMIVGAVLGALAGLALAWIANVAILPAVLRHQHKLFGPGGRPLPRLLAPSLEDLHKRTIRVYRLTLPLVFCVSCGIAGYSIVRDYIGAGS